MSSIFDFFLPIAYLSFVLGATSSELSRYYNIELTVCSVLGIGARANSSFDFFLSCCLCQSALRSGEFSSESGTFPIT